MDFELKLLDQFWISGSREADGEPLDTTSHGKISVLVNGTDISGSDDPETDYGINQAAVQLLKSVFVDHECDLEAPMVPHGCSIVCTCPNCIIDFRVTHTEDGNVALGDFYASGATEKPRRYTHHVTVPLSDYASQVVELAENALQFLPVDKSGEDYEVDAYKSVRNDIERLLLLAREYLSTNAITDEMKAEAEEADCFGWKTKNWQRPRGD